MAEPTRTPLRETNEVSSESIETPITNKFSFGSLEAIRKRLLDLSGRNNLLNFKHPKSSCIRIIDELPDQIFEVLSTASKFTLIPIPEPTERELIDAGFIKIEPKSGQRLVTTYPSAEQWAKHLNFETSYDLPEASSAGNHSKHQDTNLQTLLYGPELESRLRAIRGTAETSIEESGANILYLAMGFLEWYESRESDVARMAPLFTLPVQLERTDLSRGAYRYTLQLKDDSLISNVTLREKLANDFDLVLPQIDDETTPESYFQQIELTILKHQPRWKIRRQASIVLLNFSKQAMYEDLDPERWPAHANIEQHPIIQMFFASQKETETDRSFAFESEHKLDDLEDVHGQYPLIYDADSSQHSAIIDIVNGKSLVIEGPPGSGKSQTITNLIAACIANGQKVLFVAEKMAALNVVKNRLDKANLGDFCLELHSHKTNKQKILSDLNIRLSKQAQYASPQGIEADIERYEDLKNKLNNYASKINSLWKNTGSTIHSILQKTTRLREQYSINPSNLKIDGLNGENLTTVRQSELSDYAYMLGSIYQQMSEQAKDGKIENHYWYGIENVKLSSTEIIDLINKLQDWSISLEKLRSSWGAYLSSINLDVENNQQISEIVSFVSISQNLPNLIGGEPLDSLSQIHHKYNELKEWLDKYEEIHTDIESIANDLYIEALYDKSTPDILTKIISYLISIGTSATSDLKLLSINYDQISKATIATSEIESTLQAIRPNVPNGLQMLFNHTTLGLEELIIFIREIEKLPPDLWRYRDPIFDNADLDSLIVLLKNRLNIITPIYSKIKDEVTLENLPTSTTLKNLQSTFVNGGLFKWLSAEWRTARKSILSLSLKTKPKTEEFLALLPEIISFAEEQEGILKINHENPILENHFLGVDTPIDRISELRTWYRSVRDEYGIGFGERVEIGNQLIKLDRQFASALIDEASKGFKAKIQNYLIIIMDLSHQYPSHTLAKNKGAALYGPDGEIGKFANELSLILSKLSKISKTNELSINDLKSYEIDIRDIQKESIEWEESALTNIIKPFGRAFSLAENEFSEVNLGIARNTLAISKLVKECRYVELSIDNEPTDFNYQKVRKSGQLLQEFISEVNIKKDAFITIGQVNLQKWISTTDSSINSIVNRNALALNQTNWLNTWLEYIQLRNRLYDEGFRNFIHVIEESGMGRQNLQDIVALVINYQLTNEIFEKHPDLSNFTGLEQTAIQQRFRDYDNKLLTLQRSKIAYSASRVQPPIGVSTGRVSDYSQISLIKHEVTKKTKHIAVRSLIKRAGTAIQLLKPCFMMSPMSVAQYLEPGRFKFDLIVMDEASQIRPEDALGAIARGTRLVVVGDPKQLPPTNFFNKIVNEEDDEDEMVGLQDSESILESVMPMFNTRRLRWHYRSKHESLIAFSNQHFYDSDLVLFPSPFKTSDEFGVKLKHIEHGRFSSGRNVEEAREIVNSVALHLKNNPAESIGLVAMNAEQRGELERQLDQLAKDDQSLLKAIEINKNSEEPLFIKNLENVQGDERDVIYISMTYGPEQIGGRTMQRFGPINSDVGWRRLNVLFTRSKKRMHVFSSMTSGDVLIASSSSKGVRSLKAFLEYAETGHLHNTVQSSKPADSDFEIAVMNALKKHDYICEPQLGVAGFFLDIAVRDPGKPGRYLMGIECDGATYHSAKSARDRDRLRQDILESLGWKIRRIWSTDWFKNPQAQLQSILQELEKLKTPISETTQIYEHSGNSEKIDSSDLNLLQTIDDTETILNQIENAEESDDISLRDRLQEFDKNHIRIIYPNTDGNHRLLRPEMLDALIEHLPCSKSEFLERVPTYLRTGTSTDEAKLLEPVLTLISNYA